MYQIDRWHHAKEQVLLDAGLPWTMLRPGQFMSNTLQWAGMIKGQGTVYAPGGEGKVAPIDPRDIAAVAAVALTQPGHTEQAYQLTGPELLTVGEQVQIIAGLLGKALQYVDIPLAVAAERMRQGGMPPALVDALMEFQALIGEGKGAYRTNRVEQITGRPAHTFAEWCRAYIGAFQ